MSQQPREPIIHEGLPRIIALCGPTAVGKTALSMSLAEQLGAEIVNADSVQVYRQLNIGAAKPSLEERARVPHHLIDLCEPDEEHNVGDFAARARATIADIHARGKHALVVGGTGLYLRVLIHGLVETPPPDEAIRARHQREAQAHGAPALHAQLATIDPELAARVHPHDLIRISRGLELWEQTGQTLSSMQRAHQFARPHYQALKLALVRPRAELYARVNARVDAMLEAGFIEECRALYARYPRDARALQSLGYRQLAPFIFEEQPLEDCVTQMKQLTRRYAKQQLNWLRGEPGVRWAQAPQTDVSGAALPEVVRDVGAFLAGDDPAFTWADADPYQ